MLWAAGVCVYICRPAASYDTFSMQAGCCCCCRDKGGALFGGLAHNPWQKQGHFYGKSSLMEGQDMPCL